MMAPKKTTDYVCIREEQIQGQSRKIERLEARADFKEKRLDDLETKIEKMDKKIDELLDGFNDFKMQSNKDDTELELRLTRIETELELQKQTSKTHIAYIGIALTILTILINIYFQVH